MPLSQINPFRSDRFSTLLLPLRKKNWGVIWGFCGNKRLLLGRDSSDERSRCGRDDYDDSDRQRGSVTNPLHARPYEACDRPSRRSRASLHAVTRWQLSDQNRVVQRLPVVPSKFRHESTWQVNRTLAGVTSESWHEKVAAQSQQPQRAAAVKFAVAAGSPHSDGHGDSAGSPVRPWPTQSLCDPGSGCH